MARELEDVETVNKLRLAARQLVSEIVSGMPQTPPGPILKPTEGEGTQRGA